MRRLRAFAERLSGPRGRWLAAAALLLGALLLAAAPVRAAEPPAAADAAAAGSGAASDGVADAPARAEDDEWITVGDAALDTQRGGFDVGGLMVSFGIERVVRINGALVATTSFQINDMSRVSPEQAQAIGRQVNQLNLVQNGPGNGFDPRGMAAGQPATVIQNTLNDQRIENRTVINATSNGLGMVKDLNAAGSLRDALAGAIGTR